MLSPCLLLGQEVTVQGHVRDVVSGEPIAGVTVSLPEFRKGTYTDSSGFYSIEAPNTDTIEVLFAFFGYETIRKKIPSTSDVTLDISLSIEENVLDEVVIGEKRERVSEGAEISTINLSMEQVKKIPTLLGEKDVLKTLQLMPGVQTGSEGMAGMFVRGGGPGENLFLLDNATIYNPYHLFGFFSAFNGDALESLDFVKGGFPARYGGRLSSVIDMEMKEGNKDSLTGEAGIGLIASRLTLEGPIKKGKSSFILSGRRTYLDVLTRPFMPDEFKAGYYFYDLNGKVDYHFNDNNKIYLSGYLGQDKFYGRSNSDFGSDDMGLGWANRAATLAWDHRFSDKAFSETSLIYSGYKFNIHEEYEYMDDRAYLEYLSTVEDFSLKQEFHLLPSPQHEIRAGIMATHHTFNPEAMVYQDDQNPDDVNFDNRTQALETAVYIEDIYNPVPRLTINGGIRLSGYYVDEKHYVNPEPRISAGYKLSDNLAVKAAYAQMNQYVHQVTSTGIGLPLDLWVPSTGNIAPARSRQVSLGIFKDFIAEDITCTLEGYYKYTDKAPGFKEGASFLLMEDAQAKSRNSWEDKITQGQGWSYGAEFLIRKNAGRFTGWAGYTLSWTQLQFDDVNQGEKFYARYDRRHDISLVGMYEVSDKVQLSATWVYGTGNALTVPNATYYPYNHNPGVSSNYANTYSTRDYYEGKNDFRMIPYHRLDVGVRFIKKLPGGRTRTWDLSIYNLYWRQNPYFYMYESEEVDGEYQMVMKQVSVFPIIPSITYNMSF